MDGVIYMAVPHVLFVLDFKWIGVRCGAAYYDIAWDVVRPAFVEIVVWQRWRMTFEAGRTGRIDAHG